MELLGEHQEELRPVGKCTEKSGEGRKHGLLDRAVNSEPLGTDGGIKDVGDGSSAENVLVYRSRL